MSDQDKATAHIGHAHTGGPEAVCVQSLSFRYPDGTLALDGVNLHVPKGSVLAIVGPNGAGKTTLLKILLGLLKGYSGSVEVEGLSPDEARKRGNVIGWVPQRSAVNWSFPITVRQVVRLGLVGKTGLLQRFRRNDLEYVEHLLDLMGLAEIANRPIGDLSGGQQQRAIIARALAPRPSLLLLDEPTVGVDAAGQERFSNLVDAIRHECNLTILIVSHDLRAVLNASSRVACLNRALHFHDRPENLTPELLGHVYRCSLDGLLPAVDGCAHEASKAVREALRREQI